MPEWVYGESGDRFPVERGDILAVGSNHVLACGDLEEQHGLTVANEYGPPDLTYVDLPYNEAVAKSYRTKAGLDNDIDYSSFLKAAAWTLSLTEGEVFVEVGRENAPRVRDALRDSGADVPYIYDITYYDTEPAALVHGSYTGTPDPLPDLQGQDDEDTPRIAIENRTDPGDIVFDPCMGRGLTAVSAHDLGRQSLGLELHPRRLAVTIEKLVDRIYESGESPRPDALVSRVAVLPGETRGKESEK